MRRVVFFLFVLSTRAQQDPRFSAKSRLVSTPVVVTDGKGRFVDGLEAADFLVLDEGVPQKAVVDASVTGVAPIALVMAVQSSGISQAVLAKVRKIGAMIQPLVTGDQGCAALVAFAERVEWLAECTGDPDGLDKGMERLKTGEDKTAHMLDAAYEAIGKLRMRPNVRRILLLISESRDRGSETDLASVLSAAQEGDVTVYAATYSAFRTAFTQKDPQAGAANKKTRPERPLDPNKTASGMPPTRIDPAKPSVAETGNILAGIGELARLAKTNDAEVLTTGTGGAIFRFTKQKALEEAIQKLGAELHSEYLLSFAPQDTKPGYHKLEVKLARPGEYHVRARPGYWAAEGQ